MSILIEQVLDYLAGQGIGTKATDMFLNELPDTPNNATAVIDSSGGVVDNEVPVRNKRVQILVRNTDYETGHNLAESIFQLLHQQKDTFTFGAGSVDVMTIFAIDEPYPIGQDDNNRHIFSTNYAITYRE